MLFKNITPTAIILLPSLAIIPIFINLFKDIHAGGLNILFDFFYAALNPSLDPIILNSAIEGLKITISIAVLSWLITIFLGLILGIISSNIFWKIFKKDIYIAILIRRLLAIPRSIHEVLWGLLLLQIFGLNSYVAILSIIIPYTSVMARLTSNQLDNLDYKNIIATEQICASSLSNSLTNLFNPLISILKTYGIYRLECSIRSSVLLGVFGLGGIGTELILTTRSLQFRELWTSLWILGAVILSIQKILNSINHFNFSINPYKRSFPISVSFLILFIAIILFSFKSLNLDFSTQVEFSSLKLPEFNNLKNAFIELPIINLVYTTLIVTLFSAAIAIAIPPICLIIFSNPILSNVQDLIWLFFRIIPPPLTAFLLLLCNKPSIYVAILALGIYNIGVLGKILKDNLNLQNNSLFKTVKLVGASNQIAWIYGRISSQSRQYLAYSSYRLDVILRETTLVGVVGGVGLGWQLQESLSSFDWPAVSVITLTFMLITLIGEYISDKAQAYWLRTLTSFSELNFNQM
tara:strand:- start:250 stop:1815 length:1566 start_codon:yes stop_codon:yes gene_type:complete